MESETDWFMVRYSVSQTINLVKFIEFSPNDGTKRLSIALRNATSKQLTIVNISCDKRKL